MLTDVIRSLLTPAFLVDMFRPQPPSSTREVRAVFERLAHSSIMRLNAASMGKLYDLMAMGVKFQALASGHPSRMPLHVTSAHLAHIKDILCERCVADAAAHRSSSPVAAAAAAAAPPSAAAPAEPTAEAALQGAVREAAALGDGGGGGAGEGTLSDLLDAVGRTMAAVYAHLPPGELWALHFALLRFFQDRRVRVSVFLAEGLQLADGAFALPLKGPLPEGCAAPGTLQRFGPDGRAVGAPEPLHALAALQGGGGGERWGSAEDWRELGRNMYAGDLGRDTGSPRAKGGAGGGGGGGGGGEAFGGGPGPAAPAGAPAPSLGPAASTAGLNAFARMVGGAGGGKEAEEFQMDLEHALGIETFGGAGGEEEPAAPAPLPAALSPVAVHRVNGALGERSGRRLADSLRGELAGAPESPQSPHAAAGGDDLLSLMDALGT